MTVFADVKTQVARAALGIFNDSCREIVSSISAAVLPRIDGVAKDAGGFLFLVVAVYANEHGWGESPSSLSRMSGVAVAVNT